MDLSKKFETTDFNKSENQSNEAAITHEKKRRFPRFSCWN